MNPNTQSNLPTSGPTGLAAGSILSTYTLIEPLGRGGMGQVWKATDGKRPVAIKLLPTEFRGNVAAMAQVEEAFQIVHALTHEHICKTLGLFDDRVHGPYLVLDFIPGITLSEYQRTGGFPKKQLPVELVVEILRPVARALDYSHRKVIQLPSGDEHTGVLHRDVKPDNILIVQREGLIHEVWLIDFGLAAEIRNTMTKHTNSSIDTRGTRPYMSPEQIKGKRHQWDARTDQYSLAVVAYQLLSGHLPFDGDDEFSLMLAITQEAADPIPGLPEHVNSAVLKGLAKAKEDRFGSCVEFIEALAFRSTTGITSVFRHTNRQPELLTAPFDSQSARESQRAWAKYLRVEVEQTNSLGMKFQLIPPGSYMMGSSQQEWERMDQIARSFAIEYCSLHEEQPSHLVRITRPFWLGQTLVTRGQFRTFARATGYKTEAELDREGGSYMGDESENQASKITWLTPGFEQSDDHPVCTVSWNDAMAMLDWLSDDESFGGDYRLPTEAEWEYACRAGSSTLFPNGNDFEKLVEIGNVPREKFLDVDSVRMKAKKKFAHTSPVGAFAASPWGVFDLIGNLNEWCADYYSPDYYRRSPITDPIDTEYSRTRVFRGGSWWGAAELCRSAARGFRISLENGGGPMSIQCNDIGFRACMSSD